MSRMETEIYEGEANDSAISFLNSSDESNCALNISQSSLELLECSPIRTLNIRSSSLKEFTIRKVSSLESLAPLSKRALSLSTLQGPSILKSTSLNSPKGLSRRRIQSMDPLDRPSTKMASFLKTMDENSTSRDSILDNIDEHSTNRELSLDTLEEHSIRSLRSLNSVSDTLDEPSTSRVSASDTLDEPSTGRVSTSDTLDEPSTIRVSTSHTLDEPSTGGVSTSHTLDEPSTGRASTSDTLDEPSTGGVSTSHTLDEPSTGMVSTSDTQDEPSTGRASTSDTLDEPSTGRISCEDPLEGPSTSRNSSHRRPTSVLEVHRIETETDESFYYVLTTDRSGYFSRTLAWLKDFLFYYSRQIRNSVFYPWLIVILMILPYSAGYMGCVNFYFCCGCPSLPTLLYFVGVLGMCVMFTHLATVLSKRYFSPYLTGHEISIHVLQALYFFFIMFLFIEMCTILLYEPVFNPLHKEFCLKTFYNYAFYANIATPFVILLLMLINIPRYYDPSEDQ